MLTEEEFETAWRAAGVAEFPACRLPPDAVHNASLQRSWQLVEQHLESAHFSGIRGAAQGARGADAGPHHRRRTADGDVAIESGGVCDIVHRAGEQFGGVSDRGGAAGAGHPATREHRAHRRAAAADAARSRGAPDRIRLRAGDGPGARRGVASAARDRRDLSRPRGATAQENRVRLAGGHPTYGGLPAGGAAVVSAVAGGEHQRADSAAERADQVQNAYVATMGRVYLGLFRRYVSGLVALQEPDPTGSETVVTSAMYATGSLSFLSSWLPSASSLLPVGGLARTSTPAEQDAGTGQSVGRGFSLADRLDILQRYNAPSSILAVVMDRRQPLPAEEIFRSVGKMFIEACTTEYAFCTRYFGSVRDEHRGCARPVDLHSGGAAATRIGATAWRVGDGVVFLARGVDGVAATETSAASAGAEPAGRPAARDV
eukprot:ctg_653.g286